MGHINRKNNRDDRTYFFNKDQFDQDSPEQILYTACYQVKKDIKKHYSPSTNPYTVKDSKGDYVLLPAITSLALLMASNLMTDIYEEIAEQLEIDLEENEFDTLPPIKE